MHSAMWALVGAGVGAVVASVALRIRVKRSMARQFAAERRARQAERLAEVGAMTGGLAHEIKNPLSTIGLNAQLLAEGIESLPSGTPTPADEKQRLIRRTASLRRETERLRGILQDFLTYAGEMRLDAKPGDLNRAVEELMDFFGPQAQSQGVRLRAELEAGALPVVCDTPLLKQALLNLLLNAVQAMQGHELGDAGARPREVIVRTRRVAQGAEVHVIDTGPGIARDVQEKIFRPYFTTKAGGSGLGLPTTRRIIEAHGGKIEVFSTPGTGTDFAVTLPAQEPGTPSAP